MAETDDQTQAPTERRLQRAREEGQTPLSREVVVACGLGAATLALAMAAPGVARSTGARLQALMQHTNATPGDALREAAAALLWAVLPITAAVLLAGSLAVLLQTGWLARGAALMPDLSRLDPRRGLKRLFGLENAVEALKAVAKLGVLTWATWSALSSARQGIGVAVLWTPETLLDRIARESVHLFLSVLGAQAAIAVLDVAFIRARFLRRLRMSAYDIRQEQKESDGDPRYKARLRQIRLARARRRMLAAVPRATVVITNPTHYAVALAYERGVQAAPRIVAKGMDEVAARIRETAKQHGIPLVANPPLARALHEVPLDAEVPAEHFKAVAEIIAYVLRLRGTRGS